ncbi:MAG: hypothetical protein JWM99_2252 [Verrucomicrobiales bacterium]|nr:hypothetical protein [Verrucomicrobiales bacterium]
MKPKDIFGLAVRLLGLWFTYSGITNLPRVFAGFTDLLFVIGTFAVAWWLIGGATLLVSHAYPDPTEESGKESGILEEASAKTEA